MISPYLFNYDATWLGVPIALLAAKALRDGWLPWEREILGVAWLYPGLGDLCGLFLNAGIGPVVFASLLFVAVRRARMEKQRGRDSSADSSGDGAGVRLPDAARPSGKIEPNAA